MSHQLIITPSGPWKQELCQEPKYDPRGLRPNPVSPYTFRAHQSLAFAMKTHKTRTCLPSRPRGGWGGGGGCIRYLLFGNLMGERAGAICLLARPSEKPKKQTSKKVKAEARRWRGCFSDTGDKSPFCSSTNEQTNLQDFNKTFHQIGFWS